MVGRQPADFILSKRIIFERVDGLTVINNGIKDVVKAKLPWENVLEDLQSVWTNGKRYLFRNIWVTVQDILISQRSHESLGQTYEYGAVQMSQHLWSLELAVHRGFCFVERLCLKGSYLSTGWV